MKKINRFVMYDRSQDSPEFHELLKNPDAIFQKPDTQILKAGRSATVAKIEMNGKSYVVKRYNIKGLIHGLRRCLRPTRASTAWSLGHTLRLFDIPTAKPVAFVEKRFFKLRGKSYLIMEHVDGPHLGDYFAEERLNTENPENTRKLAQKVIDVFVALNKLRLTHGDLKKTNILVKDDQPVLIDLDGMVRHNTQMGLKFAFKKELKRFMQNWHQQPSVSGVFKEIIKKIDF